MSLYTLTVDLLLKSGSFERDSGKAARVVQRDMATIQSSMSDAARKGADEVASGFRRVAVEAIGLTSALTAIKSAIGTADEWTNLNNRLRLVTQGQAQFAVAQADVIRIAQATRQPLSATAELYQRIAMNQDALGLSGTQLARVVETISKTMVISGSSTAAAQGALIQLGQAFASGALRGEELNSVLEGAPALAQEIAKGLNVPMGKLRELGQAGKLTAEQVIGALQRQASAVDEAFGKMDGTVGQSATLFSNSLQIMIGKADQATGASKLLAAGIAALGNNLQIVAVAGAAVAAGQLTKALASRVAASNAALVADRAAAAQNLAAAQQLELRTRAAMLDAQAEVRRAAAIGGSVSVSSKAAAATLEHRQATLLLAQAQTQAAAANAGWLARAGASTLAMLGGPAGIVTMLATAAAGWLIFRDNTKVASAARSTQREVISNASKETHAGGNRRGRAAVRVSGGTALFHVVPGALQGTGRAAGERGQPHAGGRRGRARMGRRRSGGRGLRDLAQREPGRPVDGDPPHHRDAVRLQRRQRQDLVVPDHPDRARQDRHRNRGGRCSAHHLQGPG
nr:tape measure protein [Stenotrophomonas geniculata]